jgi:hypothetical protein
MNEQKRFRDRGQTLSDFDDEILVVCPQCAACARVFKKDPADPNWFTPRRLVCRNCGYTRNWVAKEIRRGWWTRPVVDDFFGIPVWLQASSGGKVLWAYNVRHLRHIEGYVRATLRESRKHPIFGGWVNQSMVERLPRWISAAHNRPLVLKLIRRMLESLPPELRDTQQAK